CRVGGNTDEDMRRLQILVTQSRALRSEQDGSGRPLRLHHQPFSRISYVGHPEVLITIPRSRGRHETAAGKSLANRIHHPGVRQYVIGAGRTRNRLAMGKLLGFYEHQVLEGHIFHGPRHGTDVAGMGGLDEHDANVGRVHLLRLFNWLQVAFGACSGHYFGCRQQKAWFLLAAPPMVAASRAGPRRPRGIAADITSVAPSKAWFLLVRRRWAASRAGPRRLRALAADITSVAPAMRGF